MIPFIHLLRGIAALLVMWVHLGLWYPAEHGYTWWAAGVWRDGLVAPLHLYQDGGHLPVLLFFLVSGFIITHVSLKETRLEFVVKRLFRLAPPLLLALLLMWLAVAIAHDSVCRYRSGTRPVRLGINRAQRDVAQLAPGKPTRAIGDLDARGGGRLLWANGGLH